MEEKRVPTLEEVKRYFVNARKVQSLYNENSYNINRETYSEIIEHWHRFIYINTENEGECHMCTLWDYKNGYAKIVEYDVGTISIEEEDIKVYKHWSSAEEVTNTFEVNSIYRFEDSIFKYKEDRVCYGFDGKGNWEVVPAMWYLTKPIQEATQKEWADKLLLEANNMYPLGSKYFNFNGKIAVTVKSKLRYSNSRGIEIITDGRGGSVYYNGVWAQKKLEK